MELGNGSNNMEVQNKKRKSRSNNLEFLGWGSKPLIEFLDSIGKESKQYSQGEVDAIVKNYVTSNNLIDPTKKRKIICDEKLEKLFKKKTVSRRNVYHLLDVHFRENHDDNDPQYAPKTSFAAISAKNIKLIFLRLEFVKGLLKENPEMFEDNMLGSIVRMISSKQNSNSKKRSYQLHQVTGVSQSSGSSREPCLRLSNLKAEVPISELSDRYFTEEELEEFHKQMKAGLHKRLTVEEFESKAQSLHRFLTKNLIDRELESLKHRIVLANERGWRGDMSYLMTQRELLSTSAEQERLLSQKPFVAVAEPETEETAPDTSEEDEEEEEEEDEEEEGLIAQQPVVVAVEAELEEMPEGVSAEQEEKPSGNSDKIEEERLECHEPVVAANEPDHGEEPEGASEKKGEDEEMVAEEEEGECCFEKPEQENMLIEELQTVAEEPEPEPPLMDTSVTEEEGRPEEENMQNTVAEEPEPETPLIGASTIQGESSATALDDIQREAEAKANYTRRILRAACQLSAAGLTFDEEDYARFGGTNSSAMHPNPARQNYLQEFSAMMMNSVRAQAQQLQQQWAQEPQQQQQQRAQALHQLQQWAQAYEQQQSSMGGGASSSGTQGLPGTVAEDPMAVVWFGLGHRGYIQGPVSLNLLRIWFQQGYLGPDFRVWKMGQDQSRSVLLEHLLNSLNLL